MVKVTRIKYSDYYDKEVVIEDIEEFDVASLEDLLLVIEDIEYTGLYITCLTPMDKVTLSKGMKIEVEMFFEQFQGVASWYDETPDCDGGIHKMVGGLSREKVDDINLLMFVEFGQLLEREGL